MNGFEIGADIATMLGGASVLTAVVFWLFKQWQELQVRRAETERRNWHGYIDPGGLNSWSVRLVEAPTESTSRVVLEVVDSTGTGNENRAQAMRQRIQNDGQLARSPSPAEYDFLKELHRNHGYGDDPDGHRIE